YGRYWTRSQSRAARRTHDRDDDPVARAQCQAAGGTQGAHPEADPRSGHVGPREPIAVDGDGRGGPVLVGEASSPGGKKSRRRSPSIPSRQEGSGGSAQRPRFTTPLFAPVIVLGR